MTLLQHSVGVGVVQGVAPPTVQVEVVLRQGELPPGHLGGDVPHLGVEHCGLGHLRLLQAGVGPVRLQHDGHELIVIQDILGTVGGPS